MREKIAQNIFTELETKIAWSLCLALVILVAAYIFAVGDTIFRAADRDNAVHLATEIEADIAVLEAEHTVLASEITLAQAKTLGFTELTPDETIYAFRSAPTALR